MNWWNILIAVGVIGTIVSLVACLLGLRGRAVDDHPVCRRCKRDLFALQTDRCPECGTTFDLTTGQNVRLGNRKRRPMLIAVGALGLGLILLIGSAIGVGVARGVAWIEHVPTSWLAPQMLSDDLKKRSDAIAEFNRRRPTLSLEAQTQIDQMLLKRQAEPMQSWDERWGDWLNTSLNAGTLSKADTDSYFKNAFEPYLRLRRQTRPGVEMPVESRWLSRVGGTVPTKVICHAGLTRLETSTGVVLYDKATEGYATSGLALDRLPLGASTQYTRPKGPLLAPGDYEILATYSMRFEVGNADVFQAEKSLKVVLKIVPDLTVHWAKSEVALDRMGRLLALERVSPQRDRPLLTRLDGNKSELRLGIFTSSVLPVAVAGNVELRWGEKSLPTADVCIAANRRIAMQRTFLAIPDEWADAIETGGVKVIILASREVAEKYSVELTEVYQGDITLDLPRVNVVDLRTKK
jgi:hypothetical protein